jgi:hypothetical protein
MGRSDSPSSIPVGSFPRPAVPSRALCFAPRDGEHYLLEAWVLVSRLPYRLLQNGDDGVSQVPGGPLIACPASSKLRRTRGARPIRHQRCCLPTPDTGSASTKSDFGAIHTAYDLAVYASPLRLPPRRKTRFRLAATLGRAGLIPARSDRKVSETPLSSTDSRHLFPFPQASPGARLAPLGTFTFTTRRDRAGSILSILLATGEPDAL